jgi:DNA polymerase/3'-5' exonuclease PolX
VISLQRRLIDSYNSVTSARGIRSHKLPTVTAEKIDPKVQIECMGSYRRGAKDSGDIDLLVNTVRSLSRRGRATGPVPRASRLRCRHVPSRARAWVTAEKIDPKVQIECMGSYRRGAKDSGDIDLLVTRERTDTVRSLSRRGRATGPVPRASRLRCRHVPSRARGADDDMYRP